MQWCSMTLSNDSLDGVLILGTRLDQVHRLDDHHHVIHLHVVSSKNAEGRCGEEVEQRREW